ncbi:ABCB family ABC transporter ATP-binding protein/permease [Gluconobacter kanchanaburiensis]|uniref:ABC transporter ATP-binding protein n=1 Tax=Gluconobacter kanchanaburiensis NBRC 103587 TaxID=1307948 RepID=A0A511B6G9_9PROT|nr:ATP-binding cassette domain-containing protein [Gluconobacter kanchanaburiensis]MBF0861124.1 ABC transporter ATP-binding protein/permease [Gluconobacter kanchanaburiensis]GEK96060.1 ABC transporter ATP-binding protein [Gluconobacter kanchanaburiensis NBRC 103587]
MSLITSSDTESNSGILSLRRLWPLIRPEKLWPDATRIGIALVLLLVESGTAVATPWLFSRMVSSLSQPEALLAVPAWLISQYAVIRIVSGLATPLRELLVKPVETDLQRRVAVLGLSHLHDLSVRFHLDRQTGALTRTLDRGADAVGTLLSLVLFNVLPNVIELLMTLTVILKIFDWRYVCLLLVALGLYSMVSYVFTRLRMTARRARNKASNQAQHRLVDSILNFETVRSFANQAHEIDRYNAARMDLRQAEISLQRYVSLSQISRGVLIAATTTTLLAMAAHDIVIHRLAVAQFVLIGSYLSGLYSSVGALNYVSAGWRNARVDLENYLELLGIRSEIIRAPEAVHLPGRLSEAGPASVEFRHVSFGYSPGRQILHDISITVPAGTSLAIVGHTGSGKSTLGRLLTRAYDPTEGCVLIDGHDLREIAPADVQHIIGTVPQDTVLFNSSIGENIGYGDLQASGDDIEKAARSAQIDVFIRALPDGYETVVGERGLKLSGGEKQRVAIARVILKDPRILLLDEATSALDTRTEAAIQRELTALSEARTTVIVAHRLSTVQDASRIVVLDAGRIVEQGSHMELLSAGGHYAAMWAAQAGENVVGQASGVDEAPRHTS